MGDWRKKKVGKKRIEYFNESGGYSIQVKEQDGSYLVTFGSLNNYRRFTNKKKALHSAMSYMRRHPKG